MLKAKAKKHLNFKLSILMPAYDSSSTISLALASTIMFKPKEAEVLVFLDGNNTSSKFLTYATKRHDVQVYNSTERIGISQGLNLLLGHASSDIVARMDADDICLPGRFKRAMLLIQRGKSDLVFMNTILFGKSLAPFFFVPQPPIGLNPQQSEAMLLLANPFSHPTMVANKSMILALGGYRASVAEDYDLWLRAQVSGHRITRLRSYGLLYRRHAGQYTKQENFAEKESSDQLLQESKKDLRLSYAARNALNPSDANLDSLVLEKIYRSSVLLRFQLHVLPRFLSLLNIKL